MITQKSLICKKSLQQKYKLPIYLTSKSNLANVPLSFGEGEFGHVLDDVDEGVTKY
jgi:hypothetical protein